MERQTNRANLLWFVPLVVSVLLALGALFQQHDLLLAASEGGETPASRILLPLVQQDLSPNDSQGGNTPTATPTTKPTDEPTVTATPSATATDEPT
ncbi:MAG TPA: hypothetical protein PKE45_25740, partial [Caldilineaceae bacterium]|nr:hypothetical protein [Caldilineaceae bacterium]